MRRDELEAAGINVPVLATVFSPMTIANKLSNGVHRAHLDSEPQAVAAGLEVITQVTCDFTRAAIAAGVVLGWLVMVNPRSDGV